MLLLCMHIQIQWGFRYHRCLRTGRPPPFPPPNFPPIIFIGLDVPHSLERGLCVRKARFYKNNNVNYICSALNCLLLMMFLRKRKKSINHYKNCRCLHVCLVFGMMYSLPAYDYHIQKIQTCIGSIIESF